MADLSLIRPKMQVLASDGELVGHVHSVDGESLMVSPTGGVGVGAGHSLPSDWVSRVDEHVHLGHGAAVVRGRWSGADARPSGQIGKSRLPWIAGLVLLAIAFLLLIWGVFYAGSSGGDTTRPIPATGQEAVNGGG